jgi:ABC-type hemin transport system substrate-binding protein
LLAWGVDVVGCTRFCLRPHLVHVGGTKDPDIAAIVALRPDLVVMDREENRAADADALGAAGLPVFATHVVALDGLAGELAALAAAVEIDPPASVWAAALPPRLTAFVPIWRRPWMTIGGDTYGSTLLAHLGVINAFASARRYPTVDLAEVAADVVLLPNEPYPFAARHVAELHAVLGRLPVRLVDGQDLFWWGVRTPAAIERLDAILSAIPARR